MQHTIITIGILGAIMSYLCRLCHGERPAQPQNAIALMKSLSFETRWWKDMRGGISIQLRIGAYCKHSKPGTVCIGWGKPRNRSCARKSTVRAKSSTSILPMAVWVEHTHVPCPPSFKAVNIQSVASEFWVRSPLHTPQPLGAGG